MARTTWHDLPTALRTAIEREAGPVTSAESPAAGRNSDFSATLRTTAGTVFCKAVTDGPRSHMHRREVAVNPWLPSHLAPRLLWTTEAKGWLALGFDHVPGRHADLTPGSPDLPAVATVVTGLAEALAHCPAEVPHLADQWRRLSAWRRLAASPGPHLDAWTTNHLDELCAWEARGIELADGDSLLHTDLHSYNILIGTHGARVVDWAWARTGAAAVDVAFLVARLIAAGHTPTEAERWAEHLAVWRTTTHDARTALAVAIWGIWTYKNLEEPRPLWDRLVPSAGSWVHHRMVEQPVR